MTYVSHRFNPNAPNVAGLEWTATALQAIAPSPGVAYGCAITSTATESVSTIDTFLLPPGGTTQPYLQCDVYDLANPIADAQTLVLAKPGTNYFNGPFWQQFAASTYSPINSTAYTRVNKIVSLADQNSIANNGTQLSYFGGDPAAPNLFMFNASNAAFWDGTTGASGATIASQRVAYVEVCIIVDNQTDDYATFDGYLQKQGGAAYSSSSGPTIIQPFSGPWRVQHAFYTNVPAGGIPWNQSDATSLVGGGWGFGAGIVHCGAGQINIYAVMLQFHLLTERRIATGFGTGSATKSSWASFPLLSPATYGSAAWSKLSGHTYVVLFSGIRANASIVYLTPNSLFGLPLATDPFESAAGSLTGTAFAGVTLGAGLVPNEAIVPGGPSQVPLLMEVGAAASVDSNPYVEPFGASITSNLAHTQGISVESTQAYGTVSVVVGATSNGMGGVLQNAPLVVELCRTSDNAVLLGPTNINPGDIPGDGNYYVHKLQMGTTPLTAGEAVYVKVSSASTPGWLMPSMFHYYWQDMAPSEAHVVLAGAVGAGGTADNADGSVTIDWPWTIGSIPPAPTGLAVTVAADAQAFVPPGGPAVINYAAITWNATALGASFDRYQVQRSDDNVTWNVIADISGEAHSYFNDIECKRNVIQYYQVRVIRLDGSISAWTSSVTATVPTPLGCDIILASNWQPALSLAFQESGDQSGGGIGGNPNAIHSYARANATSTVVHLIAGKQTPVAFRPLIEGNSDVFTRVLLLGAAGSPGSTALTNTTTDRARFDALLALIESPSIPYIAVCDGHGRRWYSFVEFVDGSYAWNGQEHQCDCKFTEVAMAPSSLFSGLPPIP